MGTEKINLNTDIFIKNYWDYYIELERQLLDIRNYVDFNSKNYNVFSMEFLKLLQVVCSEIDVVAKIIDVYFFKELKYGENFYIGKWYYYLQKAFSNLSEQSVRAIRFDKDIVPFKGCSYVKPKNKNEKYKLKDGSSTPEWWVAYNGIKHSRTSHYGKSGINYERANLKNVIYAYAALFLIETLFFDSICKKEDKDIDIQRSKLFTIEK